MFSSFVFAAVAFGGYFTFGDQTDGNLLKNYPDDDIAVMIVRVGVCMGVGFTYPLQGYIIKNSLASTLYGVGVKNDRYSLKALLFGNAKEVDSRLENADVSMISAQKYYPLVAVVIVIPLTLAISTDKLSALFQFNGATVGTFNQLICPTLIYYFANRNGVLVWKDETSINWMKVTAIAVMIGGTLLVPFMVFYAFDTLLQ